MNITSAKYITSPTSNNNCAIKIIIDTESIQVPLDPDNRHYQAIQEWAKIEGNKIEDAD